MNVLVCGSSGCVGNAVVRALHWRGHRVVEGVRGGMSAAAGSTIEADFMQPRSLEAWAECLLAQRIDAVVNCVGILMPAAGASFERIHAQGPIELFKGARLAGIRRIVQVSALGVGNGAGEAGEPDYLSSKRRADDFLGASTLDAAILRPSLIYGPQSASGRLFATLASLPLIGLPGRGRQQVQPIHVFEVAEAVAVLVEKTGCARGVYELGGRRAMSYREMLADYRAAQGLGEAIWLPLPMPLMQLGAVLAERLPQKAFCRDTLRLLSRGNSTSRNAATVLLGRPPTTLAEGLVVTPPRPAVDLRVSLSLPVERAMRASLAFLWIYTAAISALLPNRSGVIELLAHCGFSGRAGVAALVLSCTLNTGLGLATLFRPSARLYALQLVVVAGYTLVAAINFPALTIDHCGPLAKNLLVAMVLVLLWLAAAGLPGRAANARRGHVVLPNPPAPRQLSGGYARMS